MTFGFTNTPGSTGFDTPTEAEVLTEVLTVYETETGIAIDPDAASPSLALARTLAVLFQRAYVDQQGTYASGFESSAEGLAQSNLFSPIIGAPLQATASTQSLPLSGTAGAVIPAGTAVTLTTDPAGANSWALGADVTLDGAGAGVGAFTYALTGPRNIPTGSTWTIVGTVPGLTSVGPSTQPAVSGRNTETPQEYRRRFRAAFVGRQMLARVQAVAGVLTARIFENPTDNPDDFGLIHWVEILAEGGDNTEIAQAIQGARALGVRTVGAETVALSTPGLNGGTTTVRFSRPNIVEVYIVITIVQGEGYSEDTSVAARTARENAITQAVLTYTNTLDIGQDLYASQVSARALTVPSVPGVANAPSTVGIVPNPTGTTLVAAPRDRLTFAAVRITVNGA